MATNIFNIYKLKKRRNYLVAYMNLRSYQFAQEYLDKRKKYRQYGDAILDFYNDINIAPPQSPVTPGHLKANLGQFVVASSFEIALKSLLLHKGYIVHKINSKKYKADANTQQAQPVLHTAAIENRKIKSDYLERSTINFSLLLKNEYKTELSLDEDTNRLIDLFRIARNNIHFPDSDDLPEYKKFKNLYDNTDDIFKKFINDHIVPVNCELIRESNDLSCFEITRL